MVLSKILHFAGNAVLAGLCERPASTATPDLATE